MARLFTLFFMLLSLALSGQTDTVIYYSSIYKTLGSSGSASYKVQLTRSSEKNYLLTSFAKTSGQWVKNSDAVIVMESDSTLKITYSDQKESVTTRIFQKTDSGYYIRDYMNSILYQKGLSKMLFPIIRVGYWEIYNEKTGKIKIEGNYLDNIVVKNKYWFSDTEYIEDVFDYTDKNPSYEGGEFAMVQHFNSKMNYPEKAKEKNITGTVIIGMVVKKDGTMGAYHFIQTVHPLLDFEALRVLSTLPNKWIPGEINNKKVNVRYSVPITFRIRDL